MEDVMNWLMDYLVPNGLIVLMYGIIAIVIYFVIRRLLKVMDRSTKILFSLGNKFESHLVSLIKALIFLGFVYVSLNQFGLEIDTLMGLSWFKTILTILGYVFAGVMIQRFGLLMIDSMFMKSINGPIEPRQLTIYKLVKSFIKYVLWFIVIIGILDTLGIDTTSIIASAGIVGIALGFGAQDLVKDVIRGFFIIFEDQFHIGNIVEIDGFLGEVVELGLKTTHIKKWTGEVKIISNGQIGAIINYSKNKSVGVVDIGVDYKTNLSKVNQIILDYIEKIDDEDLKNPLYLGVQSLADSSVVLRIIFEADFSKQFPLKRKMLEELKILFDEAGISIPFPQMVVHRGEENVDIS